ncbi:MAG: hypothetical protein KDC34_03220, partial [Saprospiraceae bacterium]|nr:hypothetical protein [Saprospiraceae bacterium]
MKLYTSTSSFLRSLLILVSVFFINQFGYSQNQPLSCAFNGNVILLDTYDNGATNNIFTWETALSNFGIPYTQFFGDNIPNYQAWNAAVGSADPATDLVILDVTVAIPADLDLDNS